MVKLEDILFQHNWLIFIMATCGKGIILHFHSKRHINQNPALKEGYKKLVKSLLIYGNIPWVIMMLGALTGLTHNIFEYLTPKALNPIVLIWHGSIVVLCILSVRWIYFKRGAEFLEQHPGLFRMRSFNSSHHLTATQIKLFFPLMLLPVAWRLGFHDATKQGRRCLDANRFFLITMTNCLTTK